MTLLAFQLNIYFLFIQVFHTWYSCVRKLLIFFYTNGNSENFFDIVSSNSSQSNLYLEFEFFRTWQEYIRILHVPLSDSDIWARICKRLRSRGIDSACLCSLADRFVKLGCRTGLPCYIIGWWNRILGSLNVYKFGLRSLDALLLHSF